MVALNSLLEFRACSFFAPTVAKKLLDNSNSGFFTEFMKVTEHYYNSQDGLNLYYRKAVADESSNKVILLIHGWSEHSGRYFELLEQLTKSGFSVYAPDLRGHGKSAGSRGYIRRWGDYTADLMALVDIIAKENAKAKITVLGHSMGGLAAIRLIESQHFNSIFTGLITSGAFLKLAFEPPEYKTTLATLMSKYLPTLSLPEKIDGSKLTHDTSKSETYDHDPYNHGMANSRWFTETQAAQERAFDDAPRVTIPVLIMHGGDDEVASPEGSKGFFNQIKSKKKELKIYNGMLHEIFNETERRSVFNDVTNWLKANV